MGEFFVDQVNVAIEKLDESSCGGSIPTPLLANEEAQVLAQGFNALADPIRLRILSMLGTAPAGEICVCDFIVPLSRTQGTISHHLKILAEAGLVHGERRGKWVWYSLDRKRLVQLRSAMEF